MSHQTTLRDVRDAAAEIQQVALDDPHTARVCQDDLWYRVLGTIAAGALEDQVEMVNAVMHIEIP